MSFAFGFCFTKEGRSADDTGFLRLETRVLSYELGGKVAIIGEI
jgi:hypothetical protein